MRRLIAGFFVAPLGAAVATLCYALLVPWWTPPLRYEYDSMLDMLGTLTFITFVAAVMMTIGGAPLVFDLKRRNKLTLSNLISRAGMLGPLPFVAFLAIRDINLIVTWGRFFGWSHPQWGLRPSLLKILRDESPLLAHWGPLFVLCGVACSALYWLVAVYGNKAVENS